MAPGSLLLSFSITIRPARRVRGGGRPRKLDIGAAQRAVGGVQQRPSLCWAPAAERADRHSAFGKAEKEPPHRPRFLSARDRFRGVSAVEKSGRSSWIPPI